MKKIYIFVLLYLVLLGFNLNDVTAQTIDQFRFMANTTGEIAGIRLTNFNGSGSVEIPREINGLPVRVLGRYIFREKGLFTITIPNTIVIIENDVFRENLLSNLIIPNSVTSIGESAFKNNILTDVTLSNNVTLIGNWAFQHNAITNIIIPDSVTSIGSEAFRNNPITRVIIGPNVNVNRDAFPGNFRRVYNKKAGTYIRPDANSNN